MGRLDGEIAIVTGATSGLGKEIARCFAAEGAKVVVTGRSPERGEAGAAELGDAATFVAADLGTEAHCHRIVDTAVDHFGGLTVLVNNAVLIDGDQAVMGHVGDSRLYLLREGDFRGTAASVILNIRLG